MKFYKIKVMKRKVGNRGSHRESHRVRRDTEAVFENGLGTAHRMLEISGTRLRRVHPLSCRAVDRLYLSAADKAPAVRYE